MHGYPTGEREYSRCWNRGLVRGEAKSCSGAIAGPDLDLLYVILCLCVKALRNMVDKEHGMRDDLAWVWDRFAATGDAGNGPVSCALQALARLRVKVWVDFWIEAEVAPKRYEQVHLLDTPIQQVHWLFRAAHDRACLALDRSEAQDGALHSVSLSKTRSVFLQLNEEDKTLVLNNLCMAICTQQHWCLDYGGDPARLHCNTGLADILFHRIWQCPKWRDVWLRFGRALADKGNLTDNELIFALLDIPAAFCIHLDFLNAPALPALARAGLNCVSVDGGCELMDHGVPIAACAFVENFDNPISAGRIPGGAALQTAPRAELSAAVTCGAAMDEGCLFSDCAYVTNGVVKMKKKMLARMFRRAAVTVQWDVGANRRRSLVSSNKPSHDLWRRMGRDVACTWRLDIVKVKGTHELKECVEAPSREDALRRLGNLNADAGATLALCFEGKDRLINAVHQRDSKRLCQGCYGAHGGDW